MSFMEDIKITQIQKTKSKTKKRDFLFWLFVFLTFVFAGSTAYTWKENYALQNNPDRIADKERAGLIKKVSKFMVLPKDEDPTIATINDLTALAGQPFFKNAQVGDKVLIYSVAKKAILFNPTENKVIEVAPINDDPVDPVVEEQEEQDKEDSRED